MALIDAFGAYLLIRSAAFLLLRLLVLVHPIGLPGVKDVVLVTDRTLLD